MTADQRLLITVTPENGWEGIESVRFYRADGSVWAELRPPHSQAEQVDEPLNPSASDTKSSQI